MSIVATQKLQILSLLQHKDEILKQLQQSEIIDIESTSPAPATTSEAMGQYEYDLAQIKSAITFLESLGQKKKGLVESFAPPKELVSRSEFDQTCREFNCTELLQQCDDIEHRLASLKNLVHEIKSDRDKLLPWRSLNAPLDELNSTAQTNLILGALKPKQLANLKVQLAQLDSATEVVIVKQTKELVYLAIFCLWCQDSGIDSLLAKANFTTIDLPNGQRTPAEEIKQLAGLLQQTELDLKDILAEAKALSRHLLKLKLMYDHILSAKDHLETEQKLAETNYTFIIKGWIKQADLARLKARLSQITPEFAIEQIEPAKDEKHPVVIKNPPAFSPFELITQMYATPKYEEFDPSVPLSFFFALFFGICLGDLGYGLTLLSLAWYFLKRYRLPPGGIKLFKLLMFGGGVAALVGLLTGSYFGLGPTDLPQAFGPIKGLLTSVQVVDPIRSPLVMLIFSLTLGVIQILFGITLQLLMRLKNKEYTAAILDDGLWLFFLSSLVFLIVASALSLNVAGLAGKMSLLGAALLVLTQGRHKSNIIQKFLSGLLSLYKVSGYMGDTLSYSRLLALGMSSAIIGSVINILAGMVRTVPLVGLVLMIALLIIGHVFNLIISTLSAFVHSTRLQMVEFFSKFYEGGGREFKPYKRPAEYTILNS